LKALCFADQDLDDETPPATRLAMDQPTPILLTAHATALDDTALDDARHSSEGQCME
jgi:hypothetical protein